MEDKRGKHPNSLKALKEHGFKPGQSGNPKGRPPGTTLELLSPLIRVIEEQQDRVERQAAQISGYVKKLDDTEVELTISLERIEELEDESNGEMSQYEICEKCSKDTYAQQQNYEQIKEQLYKENDELKAKVKELRFELDCCQARENDDWSWREQALQRGKDLKKANHDMSFWKKVFEAANAECKTLEEEDTIKSQLIDRLKEELKPCMKAKMHEIENQIGMEQAGRSRR